MTDQMLSATTEPPPSDLSAVSRRSFAAKLARFTHRMRRPILALWVVALLVGGASAATIANSLSGGGWYVPGSDSYRAAQALQHGFTGRGKVTANLVVHDNRYTADSPQFEQRVRAAADAVRGERSLQVTGSYGWTTLSKQNRSAFLGKDRRTAIVSLALGADDGAVRRELPKVQQQLTDRFAGQDLNVSLVSEDSFWGAVNTISQQGLVKAELITMPLIAVILLLLFRGVVAALCALFVGVTAIVFTLGLLAPIAAHHELSLFVENTATMLGLGVGVDYSLFMISRFKEELAAGRDTQSAVATTLRTSGHTVLASGLTILLALATLFLVDLNVIYSIAIGGIVVVAFCVLTSVVLLPALLHLLGGRINAGRIRLPGRISSSTEKGRWYRIAMQVMRRPVLFLAVGAAVLLALAGPALQLRTFSPDERIIPQSDPVAVGFHEMQSQFGIGSTSPLQIVVQSNRPLQELPQSQADRIVRLDAAVHALPHVVGVNSAVPVLRSVSPQHPFAALDPAVFGRLPADAQAGVRHYVAAGDRTAVLEVIPDGRASSDAVRTLLTQVRSRAAALGGGSLHAVVGGETAEGIESNNVIEHHLFEVIVVMLVAVYLMLLFTFRSLLLPLKAIVLNLLSIAATYGVLVMVFQQGHLTGLLHFQKTDYLQNFVPVLLLTLLFSLSTDYEVFLLGRVREEYLTDGDNTRSVARGLTVTAPLISGAALLMVAVFGAFGFSGIMPIQQLGFGLAAAIVIDATVVRLVLVPAAMRLMGRWNWWLPGRPDPADPARVSGS